MAVVADASPARGGLATFAEMLADDPDLGRRFGMALVNTTRTAVWRGGALTGANVTRALRDAVRVFRVGRRHDIIHLQTALLPTLPLVRALLLVVSARLAGARVICHAHTGMINDGPHERFRPGPLVRALLRGLQLADRVVTVSEAGARGLRPHVGRAAVRRLDNAVDATAFCPPEDSRPPGAPATVLYVGALARAKGVVDLTSAAAALRDRRLPEWELRIVGGPNQGGHREAEVVRAEVRRRGFGDSLVGETDPAGVRRELAGAAVLALPSHSEGQPLAILEAMASSVPVVASRVGGVPDQVRDGVDGLLVPPGDTRALADALERLVADPQLRSRMGEDARHRVLERFDLPAWRERITALYRDTAPR